MRISKKGVIKRDVYPLSDIQKITFSNFDCITTGTKDNMVIKTFNRLKNYPNPFSNSNTIEINIASEGGATVDIYNSQGLLIRNLENGNLSKGIHKFNWDAKNNAGMKVSNGLYFYQVKLNNQILTNKIFLIKN